MSAEEWAHEQGYDPADLELFELVCMVFEAGQDHPKEEMEQGDT